MRRWLWIDPFLDAGVQGIIPDYTEIIGTDSETNPNTKSNNSEEFQNNKSEY